MSIVNTLLVTRVIVLENQQAEKVQHYRRSNIEISGISNEVSDENLEGKVIDICKKAGINLKPF